MKSNLNILLEILSVKRPAYGNGEALMASKYLSGAKVFMVDKNYALAYVITTDENSKTLFSCHLDTVHHDEGKQTVIYDQNLEMVYLPQDAKGCLGADDGAGMWLLLEMIKAKVPGSYIFHRGEEIGGIGSKGMAKHHRDFLAKFDRAIAFDRKGSQSIITSQFGGRCCSDEFAKDLAAALCMKHAPDPTGTFTDTANYTGIIPECTNVSIGYESCHTPNELLDVDYLLELRGACLGVGWETLVTKRDPKGVEDDIWGYGLNYNGNSSYSKSKSKKGRSYEMVFEIEGIEGDYELTLDGEFMSSHSSLAYLQGYADAYADLEGMVAVINYMTDEEEVEDDLGMVSLDEPKTLDELRDLMVKQGYDLDELEQDNPYNQWMNAY